MDINLALYSLILLFAIAVQNEALLLQDAKTILGGHHKFSYLSLVLQLILVHGQFVIIVDLSRDQQGLPHSAKFLKSKALQVSQVKDFRVLN